MLPNKCEYFIKISLFNLLSESVYGTQLHHIHAVKSTINSRLGHSDFGSRGQMFLVSFLTISKTTSYLKISVINYNRKYYACTTYPPYKPIRCKGMSLVEF